MIRDKQFIEMTDQELSALCQFVKTQCGIIIKDEKRGLINCRMQKALAALELDSFSEYFECLKSDPSGRMLSALINAVTVNYTFFMRENVHYEVLKNTVLGELKERIKDHDLRIWCAACSTGEEAYTLSMVINDFFILDKLRWNTKVLATDISTSVLEKARKGIYKNTDLQPLPSKWLERYLTPYHKNQMIFSESIRNEVIFRRFNLMEKNYPFKRKFHVIFCRNVLIYFDTDTQKQLQRQLADCLEQGGYLFIGHAEIFYDEENQFEYIAPSVYKKK